MSPATHEVTNQPPPLVGYDVFTADQALAEAVRRYAGAGVVDGLSELGRLAGSEQAQRWGAEANAYPPVLRTHDRFGHRVDEVDFHPSWDRLMEVAVGAGLHGAAWSGAPAG
ncbi:MAG TPA: DNA alkylation response protein, partial [Actinomycetes bacterium]|nr:DNA alkylation response protein [Actinomycetes bacterium]